MSSRFYVRLIQIVLLLQVLSGTACKDAPVAPVPVETPVAIIDVEPTTPSLSRGQQLQFAAIPKSAAGQTLTGRTVLWVSLDPTVLSITASGLATAHSEATARVHAIVGGLTREIEVVVGPPAVTSVALDSTLLSIDEGATSSLSATVRNALDEVLPTATVVWESLDESVAVVDAGEITAIAEGTVVVRALVGDVMAQAVVHVRPVFGGELVFTKYDGPFGAGRLYQMDVREYSSLRSVFDDNGNWHPAVSPDGQRIAFTCVAAGPGICVMDLDGGNHLRLTDSDLNYEDQPSWSPDGQQIAFRRWAQGATPGHWNPTDIWVMNADGSNQVNLTADAKSQHWPVWSPLPVDGAYRVAFVQDSVADGYETSRLALMRSNGTDRHYVTAFGWHVERRPQWTPDASALIYTREGGSSANEILLVDVASGVERSFLSTPLPSGGQFYPVFSPNGHYVAFASKHEMVSGGWEPQIYTARADGTDVRLRSSGAVGKHEFSWVVNP